MTAISDVCYQIDNAQGAEKTTEEVHFLDNFTDYSGD